MGNQCLRCYGQESAQSPSGHLQSPSAVHYTPKSKSSRDAIYTAWDTPRYTEPVNYGTVNYLQDAVESESTPPELPPPIIHPRRSAGVKSGTLASHLTARSICSIELQNDEDDYEYIEPDIYYNTNFASNRNDQPGYRNNAFLEGDELDTTNRNSYMDRSSYYELPLSVHHEESFMSEDVVDLSSLVLHPRVHRSTPVVDPIPSIDYTLSIRSQPRRVTSIYPPSCIPSNESSSSSKESVQPRTIQPSNRLSIFPPPRTKSLPVSSLDESDLKGEITNVNDVIDGSAVTNAVGAKARDYVDMSSKSEEPGKDYLVDDENDDYLYPVDMQPHRQSVLLEPKTVSSQHHIRPSSTHHRSKCAEFISRETAESESQVIKDVSESELLRLIRWLGDQDWARQYFDRPDGFHIGSRNKSNDEVNELLQKENFGNIPTILFDVDSFTYKYQKTGPSPGTRIYINHRPSRYILSSGSLRTSTQDQIITVGHLFEPLRDVGMPCIAYEGNGSYCVGRLRHLIEDFVEIPANLLSYNRIHADVAFLEPDPTECVVDNRITLSPPYGPNRRFQLCLHKGKIVKCSKVMILDQNNFVQYGHIASTLFTDKDNDLYNAISVVDTDKSMDCTITGDGDSGALVMLHQNIATGRYTDVLVYGLVTGVLTRKPREDGISESLTIVNRLWDVLRYCDQIRNPAAVDFRLT